LVEARFKDAQLKLERADEKGFRHQQGRLEELRFVLELESSAKAHMENTRNRKRTTAIE